MSKFLVSASRFTLFIILPWDEVCSVRNLPSGVSVKGLYCRLELLSGCPAFTYRLVSSDGRVLEDDHTLVVSQNVWDGYTVRIQPLDKWMSVYDGVLQGDVDPILSKGASGDGNTNEPEDRAENEVTTRSVDELGPVALYLSCWLGNRILCARLLDAGVNPNAETPFGRSAMFACMAKDNELILNFLMEHGARSNLPDLLGDTALDIGKKNMSRQCVNRIHSFHINKLQINGDTDANYDTDSSKSLKSTSSLTGNGNYSIQRRVKSAKMITINNKTDLLTKAHDDTNLNISNTFPRKLTYNPAMHRSNTYSNGFHSVNNITNNERTNKNNPNQKARMSSHNPVQHPSSKTILTSTSKTKRYFPEMESSAASTPRSSSGVATLRIASPQSRSNATKKHTSAQRSGGGRCNSTHSNNRVTWVESVAYPELQLSPTQTRNRDAKSTKSGATILMAPPNASTNGIRESYNPWHLIGQPSSPRHTSDSNSQEKPKNVDISSVLAETEDRKEDNTANAAEDSSPDTVHDAEKENEDFDDKHRAMLMASERNRLWKARKQAEARRREKENQETAKRRIQLSENQKRFHKKKESFEQWLKKKNRQRLEEESTDDSDDSSEDERERKKNNVEAFNNWLKDLDERSIKQTNPNSAISLHKRKSRALKGLIGLSNTSLEIQNKTTPEDISQYMHFHKTWQEKRSHKIDNKSEIKSLNEQKAKQHLNAMRKDILAEAVSFEEWMEYTDDRKRLAEIISQSKRRHSEEVENPKRSTSAKRNVSFEKWKQELETKEAKRKIAQLRMRRQQEKEEQLRANDRVSTAIPHEAWVQKQLQTEKQQKQQQQQQNMTRSKSKEDSDNKKEMGFEAWANKKHNEEIQRVDKSIHQVQQTRQNQDTVSVT